MQRKNYSQNATTLTCLKYKIKQFRMKFFARVGMKKGRRDSVTLSGG